MHAVTEAQSPVLPTFSFFSKYLEQRSVRDDRPFHPQVQDQAKTSGLAAEPDSDVCKLSESLRMLICARQSQQI